MCTWFGESSWWPSTAHSQKRTLRGFKPRSVMRSSPRRLGDGPDPPTSSEQPWSSFNERKDRTRHRRRLFVAKYNAAWWGDPWAEQSLWHPTRPECWIDDTTTRDAKGDREGISAQPDMADMTPGDLILVMRVAYDNTRRGGKLRPAHDPSPFRGRAKFIGVWWVVRRETRWFAGGGRPSTAIWHLPLVRFADSDAVDVRAVRSLDRTIARARPMVTPNWTVVGCADGNEEAALAAACSLPSDVFTEPNLPGLAARLARLRCGMRDQDKRYWTEIQYRHQIRSMTAATAIRRSEEHLTRQGWLTESKETEPRWGGDLDCKRVITAGAPLEHLCVEVKGTRHDPWLGKVKLERSQRDRAGRNARGTPLQEEAGYAWMLHVQPGIAPTHVKTRDSKLPPLIERSANWVDAHWREDWISRRR